MNPQERLSRLLIVYSIFYTGFGFFALFLGSYTFVILNFLQETTRIGNPLTDASDEQLWKCVSISLLWMLGILCRWASKDVNAGKHLIQLMIYCKFFSAFLLIIHFFHAGFVTPYLFGGLVDFSLGLIALIYFLRAFPGSFRKILRLSPC